MYMFICVYILLSGLLWERLYVCVCVGGGVLTKKCAKLAAVWWVSQSPYPSLHHWWTEWWTKSIFWGHAMKDHHLSIHSVFPPCMLCMIAHTQWFLSLQSYNYCVCQAHGSHGWENYRVAKVNTVKEKKKHDNFPCICISQTQQHHRATLSGLVSARAACCRRTQNQSMT